MYRIIAAAAVAGFLMSLPGVGHADDQTSVSPGVRIFAKLPGDVILPEGIAVNPANGDIYVGTFVPGGDNKLLRYTSNGMLVTKIDMGIAPLLGLFYESNSDTVYMATVGNFVGQASRIQRIDADLDPASLEDVAIIPNIGAPADLDVGNPDGSMDVITFGDFAAVPNDFTIDSTGDLYVSDSFQGAVFRVNDATSCVDPLTCTVDTIAHSGLLATVGFPPFGANGVALNDEESVLFVANTGDDRVLRLDLDTEELSVFAESVNGADGIAFDDEGRLWVAANQADRLVALNGSGRPVAELGGFGGFNEDGSPNGLLFPGSLAIHDGDIFVTNLAIALTGATGDEPEEEISVFTVSRVKVPEGE